MRNPSANSSNTSLANASKHDIMFSANTQTMCSTKGFCKVKVKSYKAFSSHPMMGLTRRDDGSDRRWCNPVVGMTVAVAVAIEEASK